MEVIEWMRSHGLALPQLAKFALAMAVIVGVPQLSRRVHLPPVVGLLLSGVVMGPHVLGIFAAHPAVADFFAELGKLLLMFFAGLEIDLNLFRRARGKSIAFGLLTTYPARTGHGSWVLVWILASRGRGVGITAGIAYAPRAVDRH
jgi:Kef-type K+ transport system membrane component KefB